MKNIKLSLLILSSIAFTAPAFADAPYLLGQLGGSKEQHSDDDYQFTGRIAAGYEWNAFMNECGSGLKLALELGYQNYQKQNYYFNATAIDYLVSADVSVSYHRHGFDLLAVADYSPNQIFDVFVKAGPAFVMQKFDLSGSTTAILSPNWRYSDRVKSTTFVPKVMAGVGVNLSDNVNLNLSYAHEFSTNKADSVSSVLAGLKYNFC